MTVQQEAIAEMIEAIKKIATVEQIEQRAKQWVDTAGMMRSIEQHEAAFLHMCAALGACMAHQSHVLDGRN